MTTYSAVYHGTAFTSDDPQRVQWLDRHVFCVDEDGMIARVLAGDHADAPGVLAAAREAGTLHELGAGQYFVPGFVDLHIHAPQWTQLGTALDRPLNEWLQIYTFPLEARYDDVDFARETYTHLVEFLLSRGTTTGLYFATVHRHSSFLLAQICAERGQRGLVGKVVMDDETENPDFYRDPDTATALAETEGFIQDVLDLRTRTGAEVYPVVTPRFIPSCTDDALRGLGELAGRYDVHIQSHCSEGVWEHGFVRDRFGKNDAFALNDFNLLGDKAVMAHCVFLDDDDVALFKQTGTAVAHCPMSNAYLGDAVAPIRRYEQAGLEIGLGTDISGGFAPSVWENLRQAVISSRLLDDGVDRDREDGQRGVQGSRLTLNEVFYFATAGGGLSLSLPIGQLAEGFAWDAQMIDTTVAGARLPILATDDLDLIFQKVMYLCSPENIRHVWVQGREVFRRAASAPVSQQGARNE